MRVRVLPRWICEREIVCAFCGANPYEYCTNRDGQHVSNHPIRVLHFAQKESRARAELEKKERAKRVADALLSLPEQGADW